MACSVKVNPPPPYSSGIAMPWQAKLRAGLPPHLPVDPVGGVHELAHPRHRRPVGQEPPHRLAQFPLLLADG